MATVIRWISRGPGVGPSRKAGRQPPPRDPQGSRRAGGERRGHPRTGVPPIQRRPRESGSAPRCSLPRWSSGGPAQTSPSTWPPAPSTSSTSSRRCRNARHLEPDPSAVTRDDDLDVGWARPLPGRGFRAGPATGSTGDWRPQGRPTRYGRSAASARWPCSRPGAATPNEPRPCPRRRWPSPGRSACWLIPRRPMPTWPPPSPPWRLASLGRASLSLHEGSLESRGQPAQPVVVVRPLREGAPPGSGRPAGTGDDHRPARPGTTWAHHHLRSWPVACLPSSCRLLRLDGSPDTGPAHAQPVDLVLGGAWPSKARQPLSRWGNTIWPASSSTPFPPCRMRPSRWATVNGLLLQSWLADAEGSVGRGPRHT